MAFTRTLGSSEYNGGGVSQTPSLPAGDLNGQLLLFLSSCTTVTATPPSAPSGYQILADLTTTDPLIVWGKIGGASESAPTANSWSAGGSICWMIAISSPTGWPAIGSVLAGAVSTHQPTTGSGATYPAHTVFATGNCLLRVTIKTGDATDDDVTAIAVTSGYTACGFHSRDLVASGLIMGAEMLTADTTFGSNATQVYPVLTTWADSRNRAGIALEFNPASASAYITVDDAAPNPGDAIVITRSANTFTNPTNVYLPDSAGTFIDVTAAVTGTGATRTLTFPSLPTTETVGSWDGANATWKKIEWNRALTLRVIDAVGTYDETITVKPPVPDHFGALTGTALYAPTGTAASDLIYTHKASGDGYGVPAVSTYLGSTVPTVVHFMAWDVSVSPKVWLDTKVVKFDVGALDGDFADAFTGADNTDLNAHTPNADIVGTGWVRNRDVSTAAAYTGDTVNIVSNQLKITAAQVGGEANVGTVNPEVIVRWVCTSDDNRASIHVRRVDDTEHIHVFIRKDGTVSVNQRVGSTNIGMLGTTSVSGLTFTAGNTYSFRVVVLGDSVKVYIDEAIVLDAVSTVTANSRGTLVGIFSGSSAYVGSGVIFDSINVYSDYVAGTRTLTFSDSTATPGQAITCTVVGADFAGTIDVGSLAGVSITPSSADLNSCTITIPAITDFDAAGTHVGTGWNRNVTVSLSDGVGAAATSTIQIVPPVEGDYGIVADTGFVYPPVGASAGQEAYVHKVSGTGVATPETFDYVAATASSVYFMAFDREVGQWLARREVSINPPDAGDPLILGLRRKSKISSKQSTRRSNREFIYRKK